MAIIGVNCLKGVLNGMKAEYIDISQLSAEEVDKIFDSYVTAASTNNKYGRVMRINKAEDRGR